MNNLFERKTSIILLIVQAVLTIAAIVIAIILGFIPDAYMVGFIVLAVIFMAYGIVSQMTNRFYAVGRILCIVICVLYVSATAYAVTNKSKYDATSDYKVIQNEQGISYIALNSEEITDISQATDYTIGVSQDQTGVVTEEVDKLKKKMDDKVNIATLENITELVEALYSGRVQVIIFEESDRKTINENHALFEADTKCLNQ